MLAPLAAVAAFPNNGVAVSIEPLSILPGGLSDRCTVARGGLALLILTVAGRIRNGEGGGFSFVRSGVDGGGVRLSMTRARLGSPELRIGRQDRGTEAATWVVGRPGWRQGRRSADAGAAHASSTSRGLAVLILATSKRIRQSGVRTLATRIRKAAGPNYRGSTTVISEKRRKSAGFSVSRCVMPCASITATRRVSWTCLPDTE